MKHTQTYEIEIIGRKAYLPLSYLAKEDFLPEKLCVSKKDGKIYLIHGSGKNWEPEHGKKLKIAIPNLATGLKGKFIIRENEAFMTKKMAQCFVPLEASIRK